MPREQCHKLCIAPMMQYTDMHDRYLLRLISKKAFLYTEMIATGSLVQRLGIKEGKNREVRRVMNHLGYNVNRLIRVSFGPFQIKNLASGEIEEVKNKILNDQLGFSKIINKNRK